MIFARPLVSLDHSYRLSSLHVHALWYCQVLGLAHDIAMSFIERLKKRKLIQWSAAYLAGAWVLLQLMEVVSEPLSVSIFLQRSALWMACIGFFMTLVVAWYHGERGTQRIVGMEIVAIAMVAAIGVGGIAVLDNGNLPMHVNSDGERLSMAVLPLSNLSDNPENDYFSQGLTEEIVNKLSRIETLKVASKRSALRYKGATDLRKVGDELGVRYALDGGVRRAGDSLRVTVQLIDTRTGFQVWSSDYEGSPEDVFRLQELTALDIASALEIELNADEVSAIRHRYTKNTEAYDAYLKGWALLQTIHSQYEVTDEQLDTARGHFEHALSLDSDYAPAIAGLSILEAAHIFFRRDESPERLARSIELARRALELEPYLPEALMAHAETYLSSRDYSKATEAFRKAIEVDSENGITWCHYAFACLISDPPDPETAEMAARESIRHTSNYFWAYETLGVALQLQGRIDEAIDAFEQCILLNPSFPSAYYRIGQIHLAATEYEQALETYQRASEKFRSPLLMTRFSLAYAGLGELDLALDSIGDALASGFRDFDEFRSHPEFQLLESDPRFAALMSKYPTSLE